jgi:hypothetical protein
MEYGNNRQREQEPENVHGPGKVRAVRGKFVMQLLNNRNKIHIVLKS